MYNLRRFDPTGSLYLSQQTSVLCRTIARSELAPILNRDRGAIAADLQTNVQELLESYSSGINVVRVNFDKADPPEEVTQCLP